MKKDVETVIFDFNGTILDDLNLCYDILNIMLKENNHEEISLKRYLEIFTFPVIDYYSKAGFDFTKESFDDLAVRFISLYQPNSLKCNLVYGVKEIFEKFKKEGKRLIILSASKKELLDEQLKALNIFDLFDDVLGTSTIKAHGKEEIAIRYLKENNIDKEKTIMIGDTLHDAHISEIIGIDCFLVSKGHQSKERLLKSNAKVLDNILEICEFVN